MEDIEQAKPVNKKRSLRILIVIIVLGLAVNLILPKMLDIGRAVDVLKAMTWWLVFAAFASEMMVYLCYGFSLSCVLRIQGENIGIIKSALIFLGSYSIGVVAGGWVGAAATTYGLLVDKGVKRSNALIAGLLPSMLANVPLILIAIIGIVTLQLGDMLTRGQLIQYSIYIFLLLIFTFGYLIALVFPKTAYKVVNWGLSNFSRIRKKPYDPDNTQAKLDRFFAAWKQMGKGRWFLPLLGTVGYYGFDVLMMYLVFRAAGYPIHAGVLFAGYGLPLLLAKMAFIVPGGVGVIETSMAALFTSFGVPNDIALVVILGYRLISFWIPFLLGFASYVSLTRKKPEPTSLDNNNG